MEDDYIIRKAAIRAVRDQTCWRYNNSAIDEIGAISNIEKITAADVRPVVRGEWIKKGCYAFCSNCGERKAIAWPTTVEELVNVYRLKFCNNCGADMRPEGREEQNG